MADPAHTHAQPHEAASRLYGLGVGLTPGLIREVVAVGLAGRNAATLFHPPNYPGYNQWAETHRSLREKLVPLGWEADDSGGFSTIINPERTVAIAVATGSERTGRLGYPEPTTKYPRGAMSHAAVRKNLQLTIPNFPGVPTEGDDPLDLKLVTWYLLYHVRHDEVRIELSCPRDIGDDGRIDSWSERILIGPIDAQLPLDGVAEDPGIDGEIDVPVEPR